MMKFEVAKKQYNIKFGYKATLKAKLISKMVDMEHKNEESLDVEEFMFFIPEVLLVGLQKFHSDEFGYDAETKNGWDEALSKVVELVEVFCDEEDGDIFGLYSSLEEEMMKESFLKSMFQKEESKKAAQTKTSKK